MASSYRFLLCAGLAVASGCAAEYGTTGIPAGGTDETFEEWLAAKGDDATPRPYFNDSAANEAASTRTRSRADLLTRYARDLLAYEQQEADYTLNRRGYTGESPLATQYDVRVDGTSCWTYQSGYDLDDIDTAVHNVEQAVDFARQIYEDLNGRPNRWFDTIVLCPNDVTGGDLVLKGKALHIGIDWNWRFGWQALPRNAQDVRNEWTAGDHLALENAQLQQYWSFINPVGVPRLVLRDTIRDAASALGRLLDQRSGDAEASLRASLRTAIRNNVLPEYRREGNAVEGAELGPTLREEALARLETMTGAELQAFAQDWARFTNDPNNAEQMSHAVVAAHEAVARGSINLNLIQTGWVTVGNFHTIHTNVSVYLPRGGRFSRYVSMQKLEHNITVEQRATIVAVYTIDDVQTNVAIAADLGLETAGLEDAFENYAVQ